ncbi:ArsR/SmtB family transcription factor [Paenibacillus sp. UNC451MF]|uniref:ArsR/SmtB family transcription factor n=1 Tax=Paenibacillus sp. UNC451MF TaxID=1449063 RepID=UPI00048DE68C|nr:helix-turn-helix domain-containing protein [Paenibacillus sp. UNC451MF]
MMIEQIQADDEKRARIFKALAEKKRIEIVRYLHVEPTRNSCGEIGKAMGMDKSNVTYHLKIMNEAELIRVVRDGQNKKIYLIEDMFQTYLPGFLESL